MYPIGEAISKTGVTVKGIRLPGHGTTVEEMKKTGWRDWLGEAERGFDELAGKCKKVSVVGLSMGGTLTLRLCETRPVFRAVPICAALKVFDRTMKYANFAWPFVHYTKDSPHKVYENFLNEYNESYDKTPVRCAAQLNILMRKTKRDLSKITCPLLVVRAAQDITVHPDSVDWVMALASSREKRLLELKKSPHVCTLGPDREELFREVTHFLTQ